MQTKKELCAIIFLAMVILLPVYSFAQRIAAGGYHSLSLCDDGTVKAWGSNGRGQLGDGTNLDRTTSVQVSGLSGIKVVAAGAYYSLAIDNNGTVWAWGDNQAGQLGDGTTTNRITPAQIIGLTDVKAIATGAWHSFALKNDGTVWAWGANFYGQLGDGTTIDRTIPIQVSELTDIKAVAGGYAHSLALKNDGTIWAWGENYGKIGDGTVINNRYTPVQVSSLTDIIAIACGNQYSLAVKNDGTAWAWGLNFYGGIGDGTTIDRSTPVEVSGLTDVKTVAGGYGHSLALKNDGSVWAWGPNNLSQLGDGTTTNRLTPVQVIGLTSITSIATGANYSIAIMNNRTTWAWGYNANGQLGDGTTMDRSIPVQVNGLCNPCDLVINAGADDFTIFNSITGVNPKPCVTLAGHIGTATSFTWTSNQGNFSSNSLSPTECPNVSTIYTLTASNDNCTISDDVVITALDLAGSTLPNVGNNPNKIYVCHNGTTLEVNGDANCSSANSLCYHLNHGDALGTCSSKMANSGQAEMQDNVQEISFDVFPNPFNNSSTLSFRLSEAELVNLEIYNVLGTRVASLFNGVAEAGKNYSLEIDRNILLSSGIYFIRLNTVGEVLNKKIILVN